MTFSERENNLGDSDHQRAEMSVSMSVPEGPTDLGRKFGSMSVLTGESAAGYQDGNQGQDQNQRAGDLDGNNEHQDPRVQQQLTHGSVRIESLPTETQNLPSARQNLRPIPTFGPGSWNEFVSRARDRSTSPPARNNVPVNPSPTQTQNIHQEDPIVFEYPFNHHQILSASRPINKNPHPQNSPPDGLPPANDNSTLSHAERIWIAAHRNESALVLSDGSDVQTPFTQAGTQARESISDESRRVMNQIYSFPPPGSRLDVERSLLHMEERMQHVGQRYRFEFLERRHLAEMEGSIQQLAVPNRHGVYPNITDEMIRLQRDVSRVREEVHRTAETRSVSPSSEEGGVWLIEGEDEGEVEWSTNTRADHQDVQPVPAMQEVSTLQTDTRDNESNPETENLQDISPLERRDISPHPRQPHISTAYANEIASIIEASNRASAERTEHDIARMQLTPGPPEPPLSYRTIFPHEGNVENASRSTPQIPTHTGRESRNAMNGTMNPATRTRRLQPSTSYHRSPSHEQSTSPTAEQQFKARTLYRIQPPAPNTAHDYLARWQLYLKRSAWRIGSCLYEELLRRRGRYTLIPPASSAISIEDVSGTTRSDKEILTAYLLSASDGVKEILRLVVQDGMHVQEAWHYILLWQEFILEWPVHKYHDEHGLVPMDLMMIMQGLDNGWGRWRMTCKCRSECAEYLAKRTIYNPFPSAEFLTARVDYGVITTQILRDYFGSRLVLLDQQWNSLAALREKNYFTARILQLATNFARGCINVETVAVKLLFDESENAKRREIFDRLKVEELLLAGPCGALSTSRA
ncbi:predicted protein [Sclerotinia sclerotiorum 1980 UF-70]|uniref:Uncharacterized protein n=2 Tax=Sclerotinia sclerotiorum (strain ATCC 18683 / 1980 / Ss-1) TaxID=665079 RepID=A7F4C2_SCLS1|nr:predicted protein [Sclerotinia sclerotiorum 1980 UF-70]APA10700.1 hypothetical protein sscle_06g054700 [Sclerotinia sclerotiorum 1980 UF-70]EDN97593.1 predicted protein [Sclerotinia sclerotiorum 1980 UF-70]